MFKLNFMLMSLSSLSLGDGGLFLSSLEKVIFLDLDCFIDGLLLLDLVAGNLCLQGLLLHGEFLGRV